MKIDNAKATFASDKADGGKMSKELSQRRRVNECPGKLVSNTMMCRHRGLHVGTLYLDRTRGPLL